MLPLELMKKDLRSYVLENRDKRDCRRVGGYFHLSSSGSGDRARDD